MHCYSSVGKELHICRALMSKKPCLCGALLLKSPICVGLFELHYTSALFLRGFLWGSFVEEPYLCRALWAALHKCPVFEGVCRKSYINVVCFGEIDREKE